MDLISNDVQRIEQAPLKMANVFFKLPLQLVITSFLVLYIMGWRPLVGVLLVLLLIPCAVIISYVCAHLRKKTAEATDQRISQMNKMI